LLAGMGIAGAPWAPIIEPIDDLLAYMGMPDYQRAAALLTLGGQRALRRFEKTLDWPKNADTKVGEKLSGADLQREVARNKAEKEGLDPKVVDEWSNKEVRDYVTAKSVDLTATGQAIKAGVEVPKGMDKTIDAGNVAQAQFDGKALDEAFKAVNGTLTKQRSPEAVEAFLSQKGLLQGKDIWIDAPKLKEVYGKETPKPGDDKYGYISGLPERITDAEAMGTEINLPRAAFLAHTSEAAYAALRPFFRLRDNGLSTDEATAWMDRHDPEHEAAKANIVEEKSGI